MNKKIFICVGIIILIILFLGLIKKIENSPVIYLTNNLSEYGSGDYEFSLNHGGLTRRYLVHVPSSYNNKTSAPLILVFHGGGGNAEDSVGYFNLNEKSNEEGFIVVYPEGTGYMINERLFGSWNGGTCCPPAYDNNVDDIGFIKKMIDELKTNFNIDNNKIFSTGMSNGAIMSYGLACELSDTIAAIGPSGSIGHFNECNQTRPVPVLHFHGEADPCAKYYGCEECTSCLGEIFVALGANIKLKKTKVISVPEFINQWRTRNKCSNKTIVTYQNKNATCITYQDCDKNAEVTLCTIKELGHNWPGNTEFEVKACDQFPNGRICNSWKNAVGALSSDIIANDKLWEFFENHPMNK
jgi:polyhydroxybutyrate depolymerase